MTDSNEERRLSRLRLVFKEQVILAIGVVVLFVALGLIVYFGAPLIGLRMCCQ